MARPELVFGLKLKNIICNFFFSCGGESVLVFISLLAHNGSKLKRHVPLSTIHQTENGYMSPFECLGHFGTLH